MADRRHPPYGEKLHPARRATPWIYNAWPGNCRETLPSLSDILLDNATIIANLSFSLPLRPFFFHVCFCREAVETNISEPVSLCSRPLLLRTIDSLFLVTLLPLPNFLQRGRFTGKRRVRVTRFDRSHVQLEIDR